MPASDIITLDNLHEKIPLWHPNDENHLYAVVDMGSNGIRFSITSMAFPRTRLLEPIYTDRAGISLYDALTPSDGGAIFPPQTMSDVASALSRFRQLALLHGVPQSQILILATEAMRRAANGGQMLEAIAAATDGLGVHILDPAVETLFGAVMGSRSGLVDVPTGALFLDLGGGSVQMTWVDTSKAGYELDAARAGESLPYGAAKLTKVLQQQPAHVQAQEIRTLQDGIVRIYDNLCARFTALNAIRKAHEAGEVATVSVYMCGGGCRGYGSMLMHNDPISPYPIPSTDTYSVPGHQFNQPTRMRQVNDKYQGSIYGMSKRRRQQFPAIATVIESLIQAVPNIGRVTFCGGSNRQGVLMLKMAPDIRESNPLEVLADVATHEPPLFQALSTLLSSSLPPGQQPDLHSTPTVLLSGLASLFIRKIWSRSGHLQNSNSSFALHDALVCNPDCPGLTHLVRALLALTLCARWGNDIAPADRILHDGLRSLVESHQQGASFWALYLGAVASVVALVFPVLPHEPTKLLSSIRFETNTSETKKGKCKVTLTISLSGQAALMVDVPELAASFKAASKALDEDSMYKANAEILILS